MSAHAISLLLSASVPLNEWPMIMVHDAATTYLEGGLLHPINNWAKTQADGGVRSELDCGARAFDWRPKVSDDGSVVMHHGTVEISHQMDDSLAELTAWAASNGTSADDLVVLGITDCDGSGCAAAVQRLLTQHNITYVTDCSRLHGMSAQQAFELGSLPHGGGVLAIFDCWVEHYNPAVACSGFGDGHLEYTCYADSSTKATPLDRMWQYVGNVTQAGPPADGRLYTVQCLWQESVDSVVVGELHGSSLLDDERRSDLNGLLRERVESGAWDVSRINMVEVNNVCDGGPALLEALRAAKRLGQRRPYAAV